MLPGGVVRRAGGSGRRARGQLSGMGVAEIREQVKAVLEPVATAYAEAASELAAEWYDMEAEGHGYKLPAAVTQVDPCGDAVDATVRYQIRRLMDGDAEGFARACGALARDAAARQLNATIIANAKRDKGSGVRFARVTTGREKCAFCYMLASRGAVYHTRETAGQFSHYHRTLRLQGRTRVRGRPRCRACRGPRPRHHARAHGPHRGADRAHLLEQ